MPGTFTLPLWEVIDIEKDNGNGFRIGLNDYPIFDPSYRDDLNNKIIRHYWNREIGLETIPMFTFAMRRKMWEIMPLYNQVYKSTQLEFDPISSVDLRTLRDDTANTTGTVDSNTAMNAGTNSGSRSVHSETPQTQLSADEDYATSADDANSATTSQNSGTQHSANTGENEAHVDSRTSGYQGSPSDLLLKYRATLLNVDMMVVNELGELFMGIWGTPEEMTPNRYRALAGWIY